MDSRSLAHSSVVKVAWFYVVLPMAAVLLQPQLSVLFLFGIPVGAVLGIYNSTRLCPEGVAPRFGVLRRCVIEWSAVETLEFRTYVPGASVDALYRSSFSTLSGLSRFRAASTIGLVLEGIPREELTAMRVRVPREWSGPACQRACCCRG